MSFETIAWHSEFARIIDQTRLPEQEVYLDITTPEQMAEAIASLRIRGAPAIGIAGAYGLVLGARRIAALPMLEFRGRLHQIAGGLAATRPTAVNLKWAIDSIMTIVDSGVEKTPQELLQRMETAACEIHAEDKRLCRQIGAHGADLIDADPVAVLTHCNAGALATGGQGTALSVVYEIQNRGRRVAVYADETRPLLQGARLTAWELGKRAIPATVLCDNMAGSLMQSGRISCVIVGADRVAANGDVANKIGTFPLAVLAHHFGLPFYVAAPYSTFDADAPTGADIPIEERSPAEIRVMGETTITPEDATVFNPAFDVTPYSLVSAFITDHGVVRPPFHFGRP